MAKYYLKQNTRKSEDYIDFSKLEKFNKFDATKLKDIDAFTSIFNNEEELKFYLCQNGLISLDSINRNLKITYKYKKQDKRIPYGLVFKDDMKLFNEQIMKEILHDNMYNFDLLEKLCNKFKEYYGQDLNIHVIKNHIVFFRDDNMQYSLPSSEKQQLIQMYKNAINRLVHGIVTKYDNKKKEEVQNYRGFRDLAMFLNKRLNEMEEMKQNNNMDQNLNNPENDIDFVEEHRNETEEFLTEEDYRRVNQNEEELIKNKEKVKTKTKQFNIPGQLTFEDMGWK